MASLASAESTPASSCRREAALISEREYLKAQLQRHGFLSARPADLRTRSLTIGKTRFAMRAWGRPSRYPSVFLHGGGGSARDWDATCGILGHDAHCVALDQRGHGDSDWSDSADYRLESFVGDIEELLRSCAWDSVTLVGFSMGGAIALAAAATLGEKCRSLALVEAGPVLREGPAITQLQRRLASPPRYESLDQAVSASGFAGDRGGRELAHAYYARLLRQSDDGMWSSKYDPRLFNGQALRESRTERAASLWSAVDRVHCPTLVIRGGLSRVFEDSDAAALAERLPRGSWLRIDELGHQLSPRGASELVTVLRSFLSATVAS